MVSNRASELSYGAGDGARDLIQSQTARLAPLTGRDHEVNLLKDRWELAQEGMGQVVLLIGEPWSG